MSILSQLEKAYLRFSAGRSARVRLYEKIADLVTNGVPVVQALDDLWARESRSGSKPNRPMAVMLNDLRRGVRDGESLSDAFVSWAPPGETMLIEAGESGGKLEDGLRQAAVVMMAESEMKGALIGGLIYPVILFIGTIILMWMFGTQVIPQFAQVLPPDRWTGAAGQMHIMSNLVTVWTFPFLGMLFVFSAFYVWSAPRMTGRVRTRLDRYPPWSMYRLWAGSSFLLSTAALVGAGVAVPEVIRRLGRHASPYLQERLAGTLYHVNSGANLGDALDRAGYGFPEQEIIDDLKIYSVLGSVDASLKKVGERWLTQGQKKIKSTSKTLNLLSIVFMGLVVVWIAVGLFSIQQQVSDSVMFGSSF